MKNSRRATSSTNKSYDDSNIPKIELIEFDEPEENNNNKKRNSDSIEDSDDGPRERSNSVNVRNSYQNSFVIKEEYEAVRSKSFFSKGRYIK